jgi:hypothetical protein
MSSLGHMHAETWSTRNGQRPHTSKRERFGRGITSWPLMPLPRVTAATTDPVAGGASSSSACGVECTCCQHKRGPPQALLQAHALLVAQL